MQFSIEIIGGIQQKQSLFPCRNILNQAHHPGCLACVMDPWHRSDVPARLHKCKQQMCSAIQLVNDAVDTMSVLTV